MICGSIPIAPAAPAASISIRPPPRSVSPIFLRELWYSARMSVLSSRIMNKAMQMLKAKLYLLKQQENAEKASGIRGEVKEIGWGNQIRSYVMQPYTMVKDHRTNAETGNVDSVMDGNIDLFINAYLKWISVGGTAEEEA